MEKHDMIFRLILGMIITFFYCCAKGFTLFQIIICEAFVLFLCLQILLYNYICIKRHGTIECDEAKIYAWIIGIAETIIFFMVMFILFENHIL